MTSTTQQMLDSIKNSPGFINAQDYESYEDYLDPTKEFDDVKYRQVATVGELD